MTTDTVKPERPDPRTALMQRLREAKAPSHSLDEDICRFLGWEEVKHADGSNRAWIHKAADGSLTQDHTQIPHWTGSVNDALSLLPDGVWYKLGKGKARTREPLYGAMLYKPDLKRDTLIGKGETDASLAAAIIIACLDASVTP